MSLRHVGDGALDDSDSKGSEAELAALAQSQRRLEPPQDADEEQEEPEPEPSTGSRRSSFSRSSASPYLYPRPNSVQPSPLSQVASQQTWTEDEKEEEDSPSPASTDSESSDEDEPVTSGLHSRRVSAASSKLGNSSNRSRRSSKSTKSVKSKERSRSSTMASLAVSTASSYGRLVKQESQSSIRTVTATPTSAYAPGAPQRDSTRDAGQISVHPVSGTLMGSRAEVGSIRSASYYSQSRPRSEVFSNELDADFDRRNAESAAASAAYEARRESVRDIETRLHEAGWEAMRETLETFADEGDIQMCAMLSLIAPKELRISSARVLRFSEGYIDLLMRLRLHTTAAYVRKYSTIDDVRESTGMETTIYTCCGKCRKPLLHPVTKLVHSGKPSGSYAYCTNCKESPTRCSICHLPVRALLFQCPVCLHGGHQACYQQYYVRRPLTELPTTGSPASVPDAHHSTPTTPESKHRGRAISRSVDGEGSDDGFSSRDGEDGRYRNHELVGVEPKNVLLGRPCAAGCGHYCWAANEAVFLNISDPESTAYATYHYSSA
ncbi:hypothetical protein NM688_g3633 [Phlebia brevispora]|uniref:Uncharacterized protein n=1 Tax=Phlebia brevispora TaxID=194682 RepID=A0ACC1T5B3_9APHY|nr:hypothetical protein NM688_g3633 [Phlebia brevispora]